MIITIMQKVNFVLHFQIFEKKTQRLQNVNSLLYKI